jgi:hypothetical protein
MKDRAGASAAAASAAALLSLPVVAAGVGSGGIEPPTTTTDPVTTTAPPADPPNPELTQARREARFWRRRARRNWGYTVRLRYALRQSFDPVRGVLLCIHAGEGAWSADTGNGYFGGLQMDRSFQWTYGRPLVQRFGFAHRWPAAAQVAVGEIAYYAGRGVAPWPNTSRGCV